MSNQYRKLTQKEIDQLLCQDCYCSDWTQISVAKDFKAKRVRSVHLSGNVKLGLFDRNITLDGGVEKATGIDHACLHNCSVGDNVYIHNVHGYIANYDLADGVVIENLKSMTVDSETSFANGLEVAVLVEAGGREIPIYDHLSAQVAYILAFYRHRPKMIKNLKKMIQVYADKIRSDRGYVGEKTALINCDTIRNVRIGAGACLQGVKQLVNGSVNSCLEDPVMIGSDVMAEDFIVCSGSELDHGTIITETFVGQGCQLDRHYAAENSVFFANCQGLHGEACSIFAGPFTVSHHKSSLLIAGMFSFLNAGSGSNQSNHMYKLGPVHQGVVERGSKTASDSYLLYPVHIGPFTLIMGRHNHNPDTSDLPFSYLIEHDNESVLSPGVNLRSVGTVRDARKWPRRDKRKDPHKLDLINFDLLSPFTIQKMIKGCHILQDLRATSGETANYYTYRGVRIKRGSLQRGLQFYQMGIVKYLGNTILNRLQDLKITDIGKLRESLQPIDQHGIGDWVDLAGMLAPAELIDKLLDDIDQESLKTLRDVEKVLQNIHENYAQYAWNWCIDQWQKRIGKNIDQITAQDILELTDEWKECVLKLDKILFKDARKEFLPIAQIGYGIDGDHHISQQDFTQVRGEFEANNFVTEVRKHMERKTKLARKITGKIKALS